MICKRNIDPHNEKNMHIRIESSITVPWWYFHPATCLTQSKHFHKRKKSLRCSCKLPASTCTTAILPHNHTSSIILNPCKTSHVTQKGYKQEQGRSRSAKSASSQPWKTHTHTLNTEAHNSSDKHKRKNTTRVHPSSLLQMLTMYKKVCETYWKTATMQWKHGQEK